MTKHGIDLGTEAVQAFCAKWRITELSVFGSVLRDDFRPDSDIDFLARFEEVAEDDEWDLFDEIHMREELEQLVGRKVDIVDRCAIEDCTNPFIKKEVLSTAEPVHARR